MAAQQNSNQRSSNPLGNFGYIAMAILVLVGLFFLARIAFNIIYWIAPVLFLATLVIDHKVVVNYGKWILGLFKSNPLYGVGASLVTFFVYPVVSIFLFGKALLNKKLKEVKKQFETKVDGEYVEYEELPTKEIPRKEIPTRRAPKKATKKEEIVPEEPLIELPPIKPIQKQTRTNKNEYEDLFGD